MKDSILLELAHRWDADAHVPECMDGSPEAAVPNAIDRGRREAKRECADALRMLVGLLGGYDAPDPILTCDSKVRA